MDQEVDNLSRLAACLRNLSELLSTYKPRKGKKISQATITDAAQALLNYSLDLTTDAVQEILDNTKSSLANLEQSVDQAKETINNIKTAKNVIAIVTSIIELGNAVVSKNPQGIAQGLDNIIKNCQ